MRFEPKRLWIAALLFLLALALAAVFLAPRLWRHFTADKLVVLCVDEDGHRVWNAQVSLVEDLRHPYPLSPGHGESRRRGPVPSWLGGRVWFSHPAFFDDGEWHRLIVARVPGKLAGSCETAFFGYAVQAASEGRFPKPDPYALVTVILRPVVALKVRVALPPGIPPRAVRVEGKYWLQLDGNAGSGTTLREATPDDAGLVAFPEVPLRSNFVATVRSEGFAESQGSLLNVAPDSPREIGVTLAPESRISGVVRDGEGRPVPGLLVVSYLPRDTGLSTPHNSGMRTDTAGRYFLPGLRGGQYRIGIEPERGYVGTGMRKINLGAGENAVADLTVARGGTVSGFVREARTGKGIVGITLRFKPAGPPEIRDRLEGVAANTRADGSFSATLPAGKHAYWIEGASGREPVDPVLSPDEDLRREIEIAPGQAAPPLLIEVKEGVLNIVPPPKGSEAYYKGNPLWITGRVVDETGQPVPKATVLRHYHSGPDRETAPDYGDYTIADENGVYYLALPSPTAPQGGYRVSVETRDTVRAESALIGAPPTIPGTDPTPRSIPDLVLKPARGRFSGQVVDPFGKAIPGVEVSLSSEHKNHVTQAHTDASGRFSFETLVEGEPSTLRFEGGGYRYLAVEGVDPSQSGRVFRLETLKANDPK